MAKKKTEVDKDIEEINSLAEKGQVIFGKEVTLKQLRKGGLSKAFLASNCPEETVEDIKTLAEVSDAEIIQLKISNTELGTVCKKPFVISVLGVIKDGSDKA